MGIDNISIVRLGVAFIAVADGRQYGLSPIRRGFTPGFVNHKKGALD
jgi:hypothetical protein